MAKRLGDVIESQREGISIRHGDKFTFDVVRFGTFKYSGEEREKVLFIDSTNPEAEPFTTSSMVVIDQMKEVVKTNATRTRDGEGREVYKMDEPFETEVKEERSTMGKYFVLT